MTALLNLWAWIRRVAGRPYPPAPDAVWDDVFEPTL